MKRALTVMAGLVPANPRRPMAPLFQKHSAPDRQSLGPPASRTTWMAGTGPAMTENDTEIMTLPVCFALVAARSASHNDDLERLGKKRLIEPLNVCGAQSFMDKLAIGDARRRLDAPIVRQFEEFGPFHCQLQQPLGRRGGLNLAALVLLERLFTRA